MISRVKLIEFGSFSLEMHSEEATFLISAEAATMAQVEDAEKAAINFAGLHFVREERKGSW